MKAQKGGDEVHGGLEESGENGVFQMAFFPRLISEYFPSRLFIYHR